MIKRYLQFIKESIVGPGETGSAKIDITDDEVEWFSSEPALQRLMGSKNPADCKISLLPPEVWYKVGDQDTINTLKGFFPDRFNVGEESENYMMEEENESLNEGKVGDMKLEVKNRVESILRWRKKISELEKDCDEFEDKIHKLEKEIEKEKIKK